jgi:hypothetical protein
MAGDARAIAFCNRAYRPSRVRRRHQTLARQRIEERSDRARILGPCASWVSCSWRESVWGGEIEDKSLAS